MKIIKKIINEVGWQLALSAVLNTIAVIIYSISLIIAIIAMQ